MIQTLASRIIKYAIRKGYVKDEEYEEYCYALNLLINILITDVSLLIIGFLMHMVWESILFWLVYKALHKFCGGYHFSNSLRCYLSSCVMSPITLVCISMVPYYAAPWQIITVVSALTLCFVSPVEAVNKPLDEREKKIIEMRYGLYGGEELTQRDIAKKLGISRSYVSRIEKSALEKLRRQF